MLLNLLASLWVSWLSMALALGSLLVTMLLGHLGSLWLLLLGLFGFLWVSWVSIAPALRLFGSLWSWALWVSMAPALGYLWVSMGLLGLYGSCSWVSMALALGSLWLVIMSFCFSEVRIANTY